MREIKFRGKDIDNDEWVYGDLLQYEVLPRILTNDLEQIECGMTTVGQYTGLKDCHGNKIFEGDIVQFKDWRKSVCGQVKYGKYNHSKCDEYSCEHFGFYVEYITKGFIEDNTGYCLFDAVSDDGIVIGNIFDNQELIKAKLETDNPTSKEKNKCSEN